jgi:hypothetical protein
MTKTLLITLGALLCLGLSSIANASVISISFDSTSTNTGGPPNAVPVGEPSNNVGLMLPGQIGAWDSLIVGQGRTQNSAISVLRSITTQGITFSFNTGLANFETFNNAGGTDDLRKSVVFLRAGGKTALSIDWSISGLDDNKFYNLVLFGQDFASNPALFSIDGFNAGNPVTTDAESDGNFMSVQSSGGEITGRFALLDGASFSAWSGLQIDSVSVSTTSGFTFFALGLLGLAFRRHNKI